MSNKTARVLAIIALVFMGIFVVTLTLTVVDYKMLHGSIGYLALSSGVFALVIFFALKADGRGYSITQMNNEIEMEKIEKALKEQQEKEEADKAAANEENADEGADADPSAEHDKDNNNAE